MFTMNTAEAQDKYNVMVNAWHKYCDDNPMGERTRYTTGELIYMSIMDFYYNYAYVRAMREAGNNHNYFYWERHEEMVRARTSLAHWLKEARTCSS